MSALFEAGHRRERAALLEVEAVVDRFEGRPAHVPGLETPLWISRQ